MPQTAFHIIGKDPQEQHIEQQMSQTTVHEHRGKDGDQWRMGLGFQADRASGHLPEINFMSLNDSIISNTDDLGRNQSITEGEFIIRPGIQAQLEQKY